jgi:hypothetical protein
MRFDMRGVDHLRVCGSPVPGKLSEQVLPNAAPRPANKAIVDCRWRTIGFRAVAPATTALENMHNAADDAAIIYPLDTAHIRRQMRLNSRPLFVAQPEQISAHHPSPNTNQYRIVRAQGLMSSDPNTIDQKGARLCSSAGNQCRDSLWVDIRETRIRIA